MADPTEADPFEDLREENTRLHNDLSFERNLNNILENIRNNSLILCQNCKCNENEKIFKVIKQFNNIYTDLKAKQNLSKLTENSEHFPIRHKAITYDNNFGFKSGNVKREPNLRTSDALALVRTPSDDSSDGNQTTDDNELMSKSFSLITQLLKGKDRSESADNQSSDEGSDSDNNLFSNQNSNQDSNAIEMIECEPSLETMFDDNDSMDSASEETNSLWIKTESNEPTTDEVFECNVCTKKFDRKLRLQNHLSKEHKIPGFECDLCDYKANTKYHLNRHKASHSSEKPFQCPIDGCGKWFKTKDYLYEHRKLMHTIKQRFKCNLCEYKTNCKTNFTHHQSRHSTDRPYRCPIVGCNKTFKCKKSLRTHKSPSHMRLNSMQLFECNICEFVTNSKQKLSIHQNSHSSTPQLECQTCAQLFASELALDEHRRQVHHNKHYYCDFPDCGKSFSSNQYLKVHKSSHFYDNKF